MSKTSVQQLAFVRFPEDWIGRTIEVWFDGAVALDSGLYSKERKERGDMPMYTRVIENGTTQTQIEDWLLHHGANGI